MYSYFVFFRSSDKTAELNKEGNRSQNTDDTNKTMDQMFSCEKCSRMFRSRKGLAVHNHCHADEQQSGCALCKKVLCTPDDVLNHRCVMTPTLIDVPDNSNNTIRAQPTFCTRCYDILVTPDEIRFHECTTNQHNYEDDFFICGVCRAAYPTKKHLIGHLYVHTGEASIECTLCRVGFTSADSLEKHACLGPVRRQ